MKEVLEVRNGLDADDGDWLCGDAGGIPRLFPAGVAGAGDCVCGALRPVRLVVFRTLAVFVLKQMMYA